jgi:quercetin dioxygenase-like cupin family protein
MFGLIYGDSMAGILRVYKCKGLRLLRLGRFQLELWICEKNSEIPNHYHADMDSHIIHVFGSGLAFRGNKSKVLPKFDWFTIFKVPAGVEHGLRNFNNSFIFLNFEVWTKGVEVTSASTNIYETRT